MLFSYPLMAAIQEVSARFGRVTGHGIAGNIRQHYSVWLLRAMVALLLIANTINLGADLGAMGDALTLLIGGPAHVYVVAFAVGCAWLEIFSRYSGPLLHGAKGQMKLTARPVALAGRASSDRSKTS